VSKYGSGIFKLMSSVIRYAYLFDEVEEVEESIHENHPKTTRKPLIKIKAFYWK